MPNAAGSIVYYAVLDDTSFLVTLHYTVSCVR